jgi:hypothetical protein
MCLIALYEFMMLFGEQLMECHQERG